MNEMCYSLLLKWDSRYSSLLNERQTRETPRTKGTGHLTKQWTNL